MSRMTLKGARELVKNSGMNAAEWQYNRWCEEARMIDDWQTYIKKGLVHPDFAGSSFKDFESRYRIELAMVERKAESWRKFLLAQLQSVALTDADGGPANIAHTVTFVDSKRSDDSESSVSEET